jgi:tetratricopeptide (TPR) repeat protein
MRALFAQAGVRWMLVIAALVGLTVVGPAIVEPMANKIRFSRMPDPKQDESSGVVRLFRGFQLSLADICYNKSIHYAHGGVVYRDLEENILSDSLAEDERHSTEADEGATSPVAEADMHEEDHEGHAHEHDHEHDHEHEGEDHEHLPLILTSKEDFRGIIGDVERAVRPYATTHVEQHTKAPESLPWLRLATWINPEHEKAWVAMSYWLKVARRDDATSRAIALLEQAVRANPRRKGVVYDKYGLRYALAHLYLYQANNPRKALTILEETLAMGEADFERLDPIQQDWLAFNFRDAAQAYKLLGQLEKALETCIRGSKLLPEEGPLRHTRDRLKKRIAEERKKATEAPNTSPRP